MDLTNHLVAVLIALITILITFFKWRFAYWKRKGLYTPTPSIPFGNGKDVFFRKELIAELWNKVYKDLRAKGLTHGGGYLMTKPFYIPADLDIVKSIMLSDFQHFQSHGNYVNEKVDPITGHLFNLSGLKWKNLRVKLTSTFTSGKMKSMFDILVHCSKDMEEVLKEPEYTEKPVDIKDILQRFTSQVIGSYAFGIDTNTINASKSELLENARIFFNNSRFEYLKNLLQYVVPHKVFELLQVKTMNETLTKYFTDTIKHTVDYREANNYIRKDFMNLLLQLKNKGNVLETGSLFDEDGKSKEVGLTMTELFAQAFVFFFAGFETASSLMTFTLYELGKNKDVQEKAREEIKRVLKKHDNKITYECVNEMEYLDKVLKESLRKYPTVPVLLRRCNSNYKIPNTDVTIEKGDMVAIPITAIQHDPELYPDPEKFDPERFSEENKSNRHPFAWIPFGEGPRICIGMRFGLLQAKVGMTTILRDYDVSVNKKTVEPFKYFPHPMVLVVRDGIWIDLKPLKH